MNNDLISRSAFFKSSLIEEMIKGTQSAPTIHTEPVQHGYWQPEIHNDVFGNPSTTRHICSICKREALYYVEDYDPEEELSEYCPNCGAKMEDNTYEAD